MDTESVQSHFDSVARRSATAFSIRDVRVPFDFTASDGRRIPAGTTIPAGQPVPMTEFARRVLAELPAPNRPGGGAFGIANNFGGFSRNRLFEDKGAIKIDHRVSDRLSAFARYPIAISRSSSPDLLPASPAATQQDCLTPTTSRESAA